MLYSACMPRTTAKTAKTAYLALRVTDECKALFEAVAEKLGLSQTGVAEIVIRDYASRNGITVKDADIRTPSKASLLSERATDRPTAEPRADVAGNIAEAKEEG